MIKRRIAVLVSAAALTGGAIAGCGSDAATTSTAAPGTQTEQQPTGQPPQMDLSALAEALGVSEDKLQAAMEANRPQPGEQPGEKAASLAKALGLSTEKVQAALQDLMPQGGPPQGGQAPPQDATNS